MAIDRALLRASWQSWAGGTLERVGPYWLQWAWTLLFCMALAVPFTVLGFLAFARESDSAWRNGSGWIYWYGRNLVVCLTIGALIHATFDLLGKLFGGQATVRRWRPWQRTLFFSGVPLACVVVGWPLGLTLAGANLRQWIQGAWGTNIIAGSLLISLLLTFFFHHYFASRSRQIEAEKRATEAQLRLLQGQIEPHFLFNTLAGVLSLIDHEPAKAKQMLHDFTEVLRSSLSAMRSDSSPLAHELELAESYLRLLGARMEDRLRWQVDADDAARAVRVPPLLLQPLVENAIHHGLEPQLQGGTVSVSARVVAAELVLEVRDDGRGPDAPPRPGVRQGHGMALANIRGRLLARYGSAASLQVRPAHPGTLAVVRLPATPHTSCVGTTEPST
ncbi:MAG: sensor histidine kinase [Leptothrix sp. (in: Bacteria)]|nr:sensor histidine kinase [Leptothrix sp. (in: b-proteobacteria)]